MQARTGYLGVRLNGEDADHRLNADYEWFDATAADLSPAAIIGPPPIPAVGGPGSGPNLLEHRSTGFPFGAEQCKYDPAGSVPGILVVQKEVRADSGGFNPWPVGVQDEFAWAGIPTQVGVFEVIVPPTSHTGSPGFLGETYIWTITRPPLPPDAPGYPGTCPLIVMSASLPGASLGTPYSEALIGDGGFPPYAFDLIDGALPAGLSLSSTGVLSGTPSVVGVAIFTVRLIDLYGCTAVRSYTVSTEVLSATTIVVTDGPTVGTPSGTFCGGAAFTLSGTGFYGTPVVTIGGVAATGIVVIDSTVLTGVTPAGTGGGVDVVVTNTGGVSVTLTDGFTYTCGCRNAQSASTLIYSALRLCNEGLLRPGRGASTEQLADGFARLNDMLNAWGIERLTMFVVLRTTHLLSASTASYTIGSGGDIDIVRPEAIEAARLILDVNAVPTFEQEIDVITDQRWQGIQQKDLQNPLAQGVYFDRGWSAGLARVYPWPVPSVGTTALVLYTLQALTAFADLTTCYTFPPGYAEAIRYQLALRLAHEFGGLRDPDLTRTLATTALARVKRGNVRPAEVGLDPRTPGLTVGGVPVDRTGGLRG